MLGAEARGFEPPVPVKAQLISSESHSAALARFLRRPHNRPGADDQGTWRVADGKTAGPGARSLAASSRRAPTGEGYRRARRTIRLSGCGPSPIRYPPCAFDYSSHALDTTMRTIRDAFRHKGRLHRRPIGDGSRDEDP
jgi:hypothetical protein